jgi:hypothetical protein
MACIHRELSLDSVNPSFPILEPTLRADNVMPDEAE